MNSRPFSVTTVAVISVTAISLMLLASYIGISRVDLSNDRIEISPAEMSERASELVRSFGFRERPAERWSEYRVEPAGEGKYVIRFVERQSLDHFGTVIDGTSIVPESQMVFGERRVVFDSKGRMVEFSVRFPKTYDSSEPVGKFDWNAAFTAAGLDLAAFTPIDPAWTPSAAADSYFAWNGKWPDDPSKMIRVDGSTFRGQLTNFLVVMPWIEPEQSRPTAATTKDRLIISASLVAVAAFIFFVLGRILGRSAHSSDHSRSAALLAVLAFVAVFAGQLTVTPQVPAFGPIFERTLYAVTLTLGSAAIVWTAFVAFSPGVSKLGHELISSWNGISNGNILSRTVGNDVLIGVLAGALFALTNAIRASISGFTDQLDSVNRLVISPFGSLALDFGWAIVAATLLFGAFSAFLSVVRNRWIAGILLFALLAAIGWFGFDGLPDRGLVVVILTLMCFVAARYGLLALLVASIVGVLSVNALVVIGLTNSPTVVIANAVLIFVGLLIYGVFASVRGRGSALVPEG